jgi:hypothetical protein
MGMDSSESLKSDVSYDVDPPVRAETGFHKHLSICPSPGNVLFVTSKKKPALLL